MNKNDPIRPKKRHITLEMLFILISVFVGAIIYSLHTSNIAYKIELNNSHKSYSNKLSWTIAYFLGERKAEIEKIASSSAIKSVFDKSVNASKQTIAQELRKFTENHQSYSIPPYSRIRLVDTSGKVIVSSHQSESKTFFPVKSSNIDQNIISSTNINGSPEINISVPCLTDGKTTGYFIATINPNSIKETLRTYNTDKKYQISLVSENNNIIFTSRSDGHKQLIYKIDLSKMTDNEIQEFKAYNQRSMQDMLGVRVPIKNTNMSVLNVIEFKPLLPGADTGYYFVFMGGISFLVLGGCYVLARIVMRNKILHATLTERDWNYQTLAAKNKQLEIEIDNHRKSKDALLRAKKSTDELIRQLQESVIREKKLAEKANTANKAKSEFLANMSHELKTPLQGILGFSDFGLQKYDTAKPESLKEYFSQIKICGEKLHKLINTLLEIVKIEADKTDFAFAPINLSMLAAMVIDEYTEKAIDKNIDIKFELPEKNDKITLDTQKIQTVIRNLLSNAVKFSPENSAITFDVHYNDNDVQLSISDNGPGIPQDEITTIFDAFHESSITKTGAGASGLGLCLCKKIIQKHNGQIWAENLAKGGAKFTIKLPYEPDTKIKTENPTLALKEL